MKLTVLSILILLLVAGLVMIQMDANTENQIQVLRETEMLTTQGLGPGDCKYVTNNPDTTGYCGNKSCTLKSTYGFGSRKVDVYEKQTAVAYNKCSQGQHPFRDCLHKTDSNGNLEWQTCATIKEYHKPRHPSSNLSGCDPIYYHTSSNVLEPDYFDRHGCNAGGGGGTAGSTTS